MQGCDPEDLAEKRFGGGVTKRDLVVADEKAKIEALQSGATKEVDEVSSWVPACGRGGGGCSILWFAAVAFACALPPR